MAHESEKDIIDVAPEVKTKAIGPGLKNYLYAFGQTPIGREFPLPTHGVVNSDSTTVKVKSGKSIKVDEAVVPLIPGKRVIIYKQGEADKT